MKKKQKLLVSYIGLLFLIACNDVSTYVIPDTLPYYKKDLALLISKPTTPIDPTLIEAITEKLESGILTLPNFPKFVNTGQIKEMYKTNPELPIILSQYVSTFALSGISDKNFSTQLGKLLQVEQLLIIQINEYPCQKCESQKSLIAKLNLIEAQTGELLWRSRITRSLDNEDIEKETFETIVFETTDLLLNEFKTTFIVPWHRWRDENLKKI